MSKRKGVGAEEKRTRMLELFYEKKEFFQLKELEKLGPKEKGVIAQSVKDVVQSLVDDGLVDTEKIGTSVYFWAFQSKAKHIKRRKADDVTSNLEQANKKLTNVRESIIKARVGREETEKRIKLLNRLEDLQSEEEVLASEVQKYKDSDPKLLEEKKSQIRLLQAAANRWTDNIFSLKSWCKNKFSIEEKVLDKQFGIPADMDYIN